MFTIEEVKEYCKSHHCFECVFNDDGSCMFAYTPHSWDIEQIEAFEKEVKNNDGE